MTGRFLKNYIAAGAVGVVSVEVGSTGVVGVVGTTGVVVGSSDMIFPFLCLALYPWIGSFKILVATLDN